MRVRKFLWLPCLIIALTGCAAHGPLASSPASTAPTLTGDPAHPGQTQGWADTRLYFGLGPADHPEQGISEATWREFLDREVTPRFPDGLSVSDVYGQWQGKEQKVPERLRSKVLIIDYPDTPANRDKIDAIRAAWKHRTGDQSVLRVTEQAEVSF
jgi:predicted small lipoprotein YifL